MMVSTSFEGPAPGVPLEAGPGPGTGLLRVGQGGQVRAHLLRPGLPDAELLPDGADTGYAPGGDVVGELARGAELQLGRLGYGREYVRAVDGCGYLRGGYGCRLGGYGRLRRLRGEPHAVPARRRPV